MASGSYSIVQPKGLACLFGGQWGLTIFQTLDCRLNVIEVFSACLKEFSRKITF